MKKLFTLIGAGILSVSSLHAQCTDLFFSEYIEGSSSNKAIEIYNPTSNTINLSDYELRRYNNGGTSPSGSQGFTTETIPAGGVFILYNSSWALTGWTPSGTNDMSSTITFYNGDDAVELVNISGGGSGVVIDAIGEVGVDPGSGWTVGTGATNNYTLVRKATVQQGQTNWAVGATEWDVHPIDTDTYLNAHTMNPCTPPSTPDVTFSAATMNVDEDGTSVTITVNIIGEDGNPTSADLVLLPAISTATEGTDFTYSATQTVTFPANDNTPQTISIPVIDNMLVDGDLTFALGLQNLTNSATLGTNDTIVVTIVDDELPVYAIEDINDLDANGEAIHSGTECVLSGYVYGVNMRGSSGVQFTLHDGTGGISVINFSSNLGYTVTEGDSVDVSGTIGQYNGLLQIQVTEINLHSQGHTLPAPTVVTALDETTESELVQINGVTIVNMSDWTGSGSGFNVDVTDGSNTYTMRIDADVDLFSMVAPDGTFDLIGIGGQFDSSSPYDEGYQILPRYNNDIQIKPMIIGGDQTICPGDSLMVDYTNVTYDWAGTNATTQGVTADTAGTYSVDVTYGTVTATVSAVITITTDLPEAGFSISDVNPCLNHQVTVTDTSVNGNSISIDFGDGGNAVTTSPATNTYSSVGNYTITLAAHSAFGCVDSAQVQITVDSCLSIDENQPVELMVYPNPSNGKFELSSNINGAYDIQVLDITGQMIRRYNTANKLFEIDITNSPAGVYFLKVTGDRVNKTMKLIVR